MTPLVASASATPAPDKLVQREDDDWDILGRIRRRIDSIVDGLRSGWDSVSSLATEAFDGFRSTLTSATDALSGVVGGVIGEVQVAWMGAISTVTELADGIRQQLGGWLGGVAGMSAAIRAAVRNMDAAALGQAWAGLQGLMSAAGDWILGAQADLFTRVGALWSDVGSGLEAAWAGAQSQFTALYDGLAEQVGAVADRIRGAWDSVVDRAGSLGGIVDELPDVLRSAIDQALDWARGVWDEIQSQWDALVAEIDGLLSSAREEVGGLWDALSEAVDAAWEGVQSGWTSFTDAIAEQVSSLVAGVGEVWHNIAGTSMGDVIDRIGKYSTFAQAVQRGIDDADGVLDEVAAPVVAQLQDGMPAAAESAGREHFDTATAQAGIDRPAAGMTTVLRTADVQVQRQARSVTSPALLWDGLTAALGAKWEQLDIWEMVKHVLWTLIWPWPTVAQELSALWEDWTHAADDLFADRSLLEDPLGWLHDLWSNVLALLDFPLALWRRINNIVMALMGWITIALTILGAIGGTVAGTVIGAIAGAVSSFGIATAPGAAGGAGAGGLAGAGAGFGVALALGELFVFSFALAEGTSIVKMLLDLLTARQTASQKERDFNQVADNFIALGILAVLLALAWLGGRIASAVGPLLKKVPLPRGLVSAAEEFGRGVRSTRPRTAPERGPGGEEVLDGERVVDSEATADGHQLKVTENGRIFVCTTCEEIQVRYSEELARDTPEMDRIRADLEEAQRMPNGDEKLQAAERIKDRLDAERARARQAEGLATKASALDRDLVNSRGAIETAKEAFRGEGVSDLRTDPGVRRELARMEAEVDATAREWQQLREKASAAKAQAEDPGVSADPDLSELAGRDIDALRDRLENLRAEAERIRSEVEERVRQNEENRLREEEQTRATEERAEEAADSADHICDDNDGTNRPDASIGDGSTEAALREEVRTGRPHRSAEGHHIKAAESIRGLRNALREIQEVRPQVRDPALLERLGEVTERATERISRLEAGLEEWNNRAATDGEVWFPDGSSRVTPGWP